MKAWDGSGARRASRASRWRRSFPREDEHPMVDEGAALRFQLERFDDYLTLEQGTSPRTLEAYQRDGGRLIEYATTKGATLPADITSRLLREFIYNLKDLGLAPSSIRRNISAVRTY